MRICRRIVLLGAVAALSVSVVRAQDPVVTPDSGPQPTASPNSYPDIDALREPGSSAKLFPEQPVTPTPALTGPGTNARNGGRNNSLINSGQHHRNGRANDMLLDQADADPLEVRVAYRRAKTMAMVRDPGLAELLREAANAKTEVQKRAFLKEYYTRLFVEVRKVDGSPEMKKHVELLSQVDQQRYDPQRRVVGGEEDLLHGGGGRRGRAR